MVYNSKYGPWALIAGASEGTGAEFSRLLAASGINLILVGRRTGPLEQLSQDLGDNTGVECVTASIDLAKADAAERLLEAVGDREVGLLVLNAGADPNGSLFLDTDVEAWKQLVARNVTTLMDTCHKFALPMRDRRGGGILIMGSGACYGGLPGIGVYGATKAFDLVFAEALWAELRPYDVDVLYYIINRTDTPAHRKLIEAKGLEWSAEGMADASDVARTGLARLPYGPVHNWGLEDEEVGYAGISAASRRQRIVAISSQMQELKEA